MGYKNYLRGIFRIFILISILASTANARIITINIENFSFTPSSVTNAVVGDTVRFHLVGGTHTTTSTSVPAGASAWNDNFSGSNDFDYVLTVVGTYNYHCTIHSSMTGSIVASAPVGIMNNNRIPSFNFYPNPFQKYLVLNLKNYSNTVNVEVYDILGKQYFSNKFSDIKDNKVVIDTDDFNPGIYFIYITTNGKKEVFRIMKNSVSGS